MVIDSTINVVEDLTCFHLKTGNSWNRNAMQKKKEWVKKCKFNMYLKKKPAVKCWKALEKYLLFSRILRNELNDWEKCSMINMK